MLGEDGPNKHGSDTWSVLGQVTRNIGPKAEHPSHL